MNREYTAYGLWHVTTEGDCEGRTVTDLGEHEGFLDEIAFRLGAKSYYSLHFQLINPKDRKLPLPEPKPVQSVSVQLGIDSGTWDLTREERALAVGKILKDRKVNVSTGTFYASVVLAQEKK